MAQTRLKLSSLWLKPGALKKKLKCWYRKIVLHESLNSITCQVLIFDSKKHGLDTDTLLIKVTFQQAVQNNDNLTFLIAFAFPKDTLVSLGATG